MGCEPFKPPFLISISKRSSVHLSLTLLANVNNLLRVQTICKPVYVSESDLAFLAAAKKNELILQNLTFV